MHNVRRSVLAVMLMCGIAGSVQAANFEQSWVAPKYTTCEGVGMAGSFRVYVSGTVDTGPGGAKSIKTLTSYVSSGSFTQFEGSTSARAFVKVGTAETKSVSLARPSGSVIEPAPKPDESRRLYLPNGAVLAVPANGELWIASTPTLKTDAGMCVLGTFEHKVDLP